MQNKLLYLLYVHNMNSDVIIILHSRYRFAIVDQFPYNLQALRYKRVQILT